MLVVSHYNYLPGACGLCRSSNLPAVDTNVDLDWPNSADNPNPSASHRLYICADCCIHLANMVKDARGLEIKPAEHYTLLQSLNQELANTNAAIAQRVHELEKALTVVQSVNTTPIIVEESPVVDMTGFEVVPPPKPKGKK